jgi:hypothetical protein
MSTARLVDILLVILIGIVLTVPLVRRIVQRRFDPFEPYLVFAAAYGVMFVVRPAAMLASDSLAYEGPRRLLDVSATFTEMLVLALLGAIGFVAGYVAPVGRSLARRRPRSEASLDIRRLMILAAALASIGLVAFSVTLAVEGGISSVADIFQSGSSADTGEAADKYRYLWMSFLFLIPSALVFLAIGLRTGKRLAFTTFALISTLILLRTIPLGHRMVLLPFIGGVFVLVYLSRRARPSVVTLLVIGAVTLFASAFLSDLRGRDTRDESVAETLARASSPSRLADSVLSGPDSEMAPTFAAALSVIPEILPHTYGATIFKDLVVRPVPRSLWSGKPEVPRNELKSTVWPVEYARGTINPEFSALLYFYWDFGIIGVLLGLGVYGVAARLLYECFLRNAENLSVQVLYSLSLWFLVIALRDSPVDTLIRAAFIVLPAWALFRFARIAAQAKRGRAPFTAAGPAG